MLTVSSKALTLRDLVDRAMTRQRVTSGRALADRAKSLGHTLVHTTVNGIRGGTYRARPGVETVLALARLAGVSDEVAFEAAGLPVPGPRLADQLPPEADLLTQRERNLVIETIRVLALARKEVVSDGKPQPRREATQQAGSAPRYETDPDINRDGDGSLVLTPEYVEAMGWAARLGNVETSENEENPDTPDSR